MSEHDEQVALFEWSDWKANQDPAYGLMHAVPNGGHRHKAVAAKMKAEGVKAGVPDICLPVPRGGYHGMYVELKVGDNQPTEQQEWWLERLAEQGYIVVVAWGFDDAVAAVETYMEHPETLTP